MAEYVSKYTGEAIDGFLTFVNENQSVLNVKEQPLDIAYGGTGATTAAEALTNLGVAAAEHTHDTIVDSIDGKSSIYFTNNETNTGSTIVFNSESHIKETVLGGFGLDSDYTRLLSAELLYGNDSGTTGTISLSSYAINYLFIDIIFGNGDGRISGTTRVYLPNKKTAEISCNLVGENGYHADYFARYYIHDAIMSPSVNSSYSSLLNSTESVSSDTLYVMYVIGYR